MVALLLVVAACDAGTPAVPPLATAAAGTGAADSTQSTSTTSGSTTRRSSPSAASSTAVSGAAESTAASGAASAAPVAGGQASGLTIPQPRPTGGPSAEAPGPFILSNPLTTPAATLSVNGTGEYEGRRGSGSWRVPGTGLGVDIDAVAGAPWDYQYVHVPAGATLAISVDQAGIVGMHASAAESITRVPAVGLPVHEVELAAVKPPAGALASGSTGWLGAPPVGDWVVDAIIDFGAWGQISYSWRLAVETSPPDIASTLPKPAAYGWFNLDWWQGCPPVVSRESPCSNASEPRNASFTLTVGTLAGTSRVVVRRDFGQPAGNLDYWRAEPFAFMSGPDSVVYGFWDGSHSELHRVSVTSGRDALLLRGSRPIYRAAADRQTGRTYLSLVYAVNRHEAGIWVLEPGAKAAELLVKHRADLASDRVMNGWERRLEVTPDGDLLDVVDCEARVCEQRAYETRLGRLLVDEPKSAPQIELFGVANGQLFGGTASGGDARVEYQSVGGGPWRDVPVHGCAVDGKVALDADENPLLLLDLGSGTCDAGSTELVAFDPVDFSTRTILGADTGGADHSARVVPTTPFQGYAAPLGWTLVAPDGELRSPSAGKAGSAPPALVRLSDGFSIPLTGWAR